MKSKPRREGVQLTIGLLIWMAGEAPAYADFLYTGSRNSGITRVDERTGEIVAKFATREDGFHTFRGMALGPDGLLYVSSWYDHARIRGAWGVYQFDPTSGELTGTFTTSGPLNGIQFGTDGDLYGRYSTSGQLRRFDGETGEAIRTESDRLDFVEGVGRFLLESDGSTVFATSRGHLAEYELATGEQLGQGFFTDDIELGQYWFDQMAIGPDGLLYAAYNYPYRDTVLKGGVIRFDPETMQFIDIFRDDVPAFGASNGGALGLAFGPGGDLYVGSQHKEAILRYDVETRELVREYPIPGLAHSANYIVFLPVPEPSAVALVCLGAMLLGSIRLAVPRRSVKRGPMESLN